MTLDYEKLGTTVGTVEEEWKAFKGAFVDVAEELCGRTSGKEIIIIKKENQTWWTEEVVKAVGEKGEIWKMTEGIKENGEQPNTTLQHLYGQKTKAARRAKREMEEELYRQLDEDYGKKLINKMAHERDEDSKGRKNWISNQRQEWEASH